MPNRTWVITSGLACEDLDMIEMISEESVAAPTQNIASTAKGHNMPSGKRSLVTGHWGQGQINFRAGVKLIQKRVQKISLRSAYIYVHYSGELERGLQQPTYTGEGLT